MSDSMAIPVACDCLGRTCLKWAPDGELTQLDFRLVMQRLAQVDPEVMELHESTPDPEACPSCS